MWIVMGIVISIAIVCLLVFLLLKRWNNYVLIARNLTYIYEILHDEYKERFPDEDTLLITCGVIDTLSYKFPLEDMKAAVLRAKDGKCFFENSAYNQINEREVFLMFKQTSNLFLSFVLELEIMIFLKDSSLSRQNILTAVVSVTEKIERAIDSAKRSYASGRKPPLWNRAASNFMTSDAFEGVRNELGIIPSTPREQLDELFQELIQRKHWKKINPDIIKSIFNNAKGDVDAVKRFIFISELHNSVGNNFVELATSVSRKYILSMFALTLYRLGSGILKAAISAIEHKDKEKLEHCVIPADMAFTSSILCDPYLLSAYAGMALLYGYVWINKDAALEFCRKYKEVEHKLLNTPDEELSASELTAKKNLDPEEYQRKLRMLAEHSPHLLPDDDIEFDGETMIDKINELEAELLQS